MKLPSFKRLDKQNFPLDFKELIDKLGFIFNSNQEPVYDVLNGKVSLKDNILCTIKDVQVMVDSDGLPKNSNSSFKLDNSNMRVLGCEVIRALNQVSSNTYPTSHPFISFSQNSGIVSINHVSGLQADQTYILTIIAWGN